ncbi:OLC1v1034271C1 [Oldenlandia corymbosa var. corymbosa]|uniref:OLC1v1034271C1 n=1 Tax=Oldenlandia corymbosa var. corymbosa TaxID=529605 RepID=A0AAV1CTD0_OLDCO|nr:OLC1v1034271C1 [Oldenlandia corymbosa var. corymbosa]
MKLKLSLLFFSYLSLVALVNGADNERKTYIVYMGEMPEYRISAVDQHHNLLREAIKDEKIARESRIYSYEQSFNGFAARLLPHEADWLSQHESVVSVFLSKKLKLHTTRSWDFLGMNSKIPRMPQVESNTIVALLDTGVWIKSASFNDEGFGPPPSKWKGKCDKGVNFTGCNNKVIGARYFNLAGAADDDPLTPADLHGHGSHTASTAAGVAVPDTNLFGLANGIARGGVPSARIASYKVCWSKGCQDADLLAGFDAAIADGADIISVSIGGSTTTFLDDPIAIGAFHAMKRGILTLCAGGNDGPEFSTVENTAPWIMTVAASSIDRQFQSLVRLGDGTKIPGISVNTFTAAKQQYPLLNGFLARKESPKNSSACESGSLREDKVKGRIVYCQGSLGQDTIIKELGGIGIITSMDSFTDTAFPAVISASSVTVTDGQKIDRYINSTKGAATAVIDKSVTVSLTAPSIASFSSRGPQIITNNILKPDIAAPGIDILAAYSPAVTMSGEAGDNRLVNYNVISGTSMACPHVAAAAAYVKTFHPNWSIAAIKSALMTTAKPMKVQPEGAELSAGAGLIDPVSALNPGLIYEADMNSYITFLCKEGYNSSDIGLISGNKTKSCSSYPSAKGSDGLNYPTMQLRVNLSSTTISAVFYRTVTYVGQNKTMYKASVTAPKGLMVTIVPNTLSFSKQNEQQSFQVLLNGSFVGNKPWFISASLVWSDSKNNVKCPILVYKPLY